MLRDSSHRSSQARLLTSAKTPPGRRQSPTDRQPSSSTMTSEARRASWQQHHHDQRRVPSFGLERNYRDCSDQELIVVDDPGEQEDWRRNAQMLTERDEMLLLAGDDVLDIAPVNRRLQQARARKNQSPATERSSSQQSLANKTPTPTSNQRLAQRMIFTSHKLQESKNKQQDQTRAKASSKKQRLRLLSGSSERDQHDDENAEQTLLREEEDDNSSISFAQSGCHSILSAWRIKAANRAAKLAASRQAKSNKQQPERPTSVLSQTSSQGLRSVASTAHTLGSRLSRPGGGQAAGSRIPLGPKSAQHFVTNTRRRRRANELIMSTLEARRRAISLNRQNATGSLFGSESYLVGGGDEQPPLLSAAGQMPLDQDYQRLSLSPSPAGVLSLGRRTPSPAGLSFNQAHPELTKRSALSDLGGRQSPAMAAQRHKLLLAAQQRLEPRRPKLPQRNLQRGSKSQSHSSLGSGRPPLAKLDQNSSDLCSSNESSSGAESQESNSSSGSQFTQLVTSELTPSRILLDDNDEDYERQRSKHRELLIKTTTLATTTTTARHATKNLQQTEAPPRPPSRTKRKQQEGTSKSESNAQTSASHQESRRRESSQRIPVSSKTSKQQQISTSTSGDDDDKPGGKLRRGALKRDSIRRLRLSRKQSQQRQEESSSSQEAPPVLSASFEQELEKRRLKQKSQQQEAEAANKLRPLSKARKMDIENNPFLNRHHFRSLSTRSTDSRQSLHPSQQLPTGSARRQQLQQTLAEALVRPEEEPPQRVQAPTRLRSPSPRVPTGATDRQEPSAKPPSRSSKSHVDEMPQVDIENVRQVERMLRDMKPGQVIRSQAREQATARSNQMETSHRQPATPAPRVLQQEALKNDSDENFFKTTTKLVRESARSSDDLKADLQSGNRRQFRVDERWRHERQVPIRLADGSIFSEEKFSSERLEVRRSQEQLSGGSNIGLPAGFSDTDSSPPAPPARRNQQTTRITPTSSPPSQFSPTRPPKPSDRFGSGSTAAQQASNFTSLLAPRPKSEERPKQQLRVQQTEQPRPPAIKPRTSASRGQPVLHQSSSREPRPPIEPKPLDPVNVLQASLPKFERSADDEFKKRVDHLRQIARTNLEESQARQAKEAKRLRDKSRLVKPLSTNWDSPLGSSGAEHDSPARERSRAATQPPETSSLERHSTQRRSMQQVASTNLDDMLLADRYQRPIDKLPAGAWRRSNSSLASVGLASRGSTTKALHEQPSRAMSPQFGLPRQPLGLPSSSGSVLSHSVLSIGPRDSELEAPVRVVVREKSAPKLDFAQMEQRPPTQLARNIEPPPLASREIPAAKTSATFTQRPAASSEPPSISRQVFPPTSSNLSSSQQQQTRAAISRPAAASPRSPEFGQTAASSNDDSAIASSVSSPSSMSFALSSATQHQQPVTLRPWGTIAPTQQQPQKSVGLADKPFAYSATTTATTTSTMTSSATSKQLPGLRPTTILDAAQGTTSSGALQSILRRQQMAANLATSGSSESASAESQGFGGASNIQHQTFPMTTNLQPFQQQQQPLMLQQQQRPATSASEQQGQRAAAASQLVQSSPAKRVHFNDRTSVRSFESISSTNSNTTAIPQQCADQMNEFDARQLVGSPDSMASSRLSESPAFGDFRARDPNSQASGGAAIYAVRGDPDFEQQQPPPPFQQRQQGLVPPQLPRRAPASSTIHFAYDAQRQFMMSPPHQHHQKPLVMSPSSGPQYVLKPNYDLQTAQFPQQQLGSPLSGSIRMTAPSAINTATSSVPSSYQHGLVSPPGCGRPLPQAQPYVLGQPHQPQVVLVSPQARSLVTSDSLDEDDPNYALRLRQAATQRAFNYIQPSPQQQQQLGGGLAAVPLSPQQQHQAPKQSTNQSGGGSSGTQRRLSIDLANFQTEV